MKRIRHYGVSSVFARISQILNRLVLNRKHHDLPLWNATPASSPFAVPNAMPWLLSANGRDFEHLADFLAALMRKIQPREWSRLYAEFREMILKRDQIGRLQGLPPDVAVELLGAATLCSNGYTREAALQALADLRHPRAVPYTLLRLGDWVAEVRDAASRTLGGLLRLDIADELLTHYHLVDRLSGFQRVKADQSIAEIRRVLLSPESRAAIHRALESKHAPCRLRAYRILEDQMDEPTWTQAATDPDSSIRHWSVRQLSRSALVVPPERVARLLRDKANIVSAAMIRTLTPAQAIEQRDVLIDLVFSDSLTVRNAARFALCITAMPDLAVEARLRLAASDPVSAPSGVLASLGEIGSEADCQLVLSFLGSPRSRVREAAVRTLIRLGRGAYMKRILPFLNDPSGRVRRAAARALSEPELAQWTPTIRRILETGSEGGQVQSLAVLIRQSGWNPVPDLLRGLVSDYARVREAAWQHIHEWVKTIGVRGWIRPTPDTLSVLAHIWPSIKRLDPTPPHGVNRGWNELRRLIEEELRAK